MTKGRLDDVFFDFTCLKYLCFKVEVLMVKYYWLSFAINLFTINIVLK